jgi:uncharacterized damage-inducible protein DinB
MEQVRGMLKKFLKDLSPDEWFRQPSEGVTHIAWQAGHVASSQYALCLVRTRGALAEDEQLIPEAFRKRYGRGSTPDPNPEANASAEELLATLDAVAARSEEELRGFVDADLDLPMDKPHPMFSTNLGAVEFCPYHEILHIGQVVLLRRLIGREPQW